MDYQILTPDEFAKRLKISRTTEFEWRRKGYLKEGRHYFKHERTIRYIWNKESVENLFERCNPEDGLPLS